MCRELVRVMCVAVLAVAFASTAIAQEVPDAVQSSPELVTRVEGVWTNSQWPRIVPPGVADQRIDVGLIPFTADFDTNFLATLVGVTNGGVNQFVVRASETNEPDHSRIWFNATGGVVMTSPINYDVDAWIATNYGAMPSYIAADPTNAAQWSADRTPLRIYVSASLIATGDVPAYLSNLVASAGTGADTNDNPVPMLELCGTNICLVQVAMTEGPVQILVHATNTIASFNIFSTLDLMDANSWTLDANLDHVSDPVLFQWIESRSSETSSVWKFLAAGNGSQDTDGDGIPDSIEMMITHTDLHNDDTDGDGLTDGQEFRQYASNPNAFSSGNDGLSDGWKVANNFNPAALMDGNAEWQSGITYFQLAGMGLPTNAPVIELEDYETYQGYRSQWASSWKVGTTQLDWDRTGISNGVTRYFLNSGATATWTKDGTWDGYPYHYYELISLTNSFSPGLRQMDAAACIVQCTNDLVGAFLQLHDERGSYLASCGGTSGMTTTIVYDDLSDLDYTTNTLWNGTLSDELWVTWLRSIGSETLTPTQQVLSFSYVHSNGLIEAMSYLHVLSNEFTTAMLDETATNELAKCPSMTNLAWGLYWLYAFTFDVGEGYEAYDMCSQSIWTAKPYAERHLATNEFTLSLGRMQYRITCPETVTGAVYRTSVFHNFYPDDDTNLAIVAFHSYVTNGNGGEITLTPPDGVTVEPPASNGYVMLEHFVFDVRNPTDSNHDRIVNDLAGTNNAWTGSAFGFVRGTTNWCQIPVRVTAWGPTGSLMGNITAQMSPIPLASNGICSLTWDNPLGSDPTIGLLVENPSSHLWEATATYSNLPPIPTNSYGRVPEGLHELLYGAKTLTVTIANCDWLPEIERTRKVPYELYYGDSLVIASQKMADTTWNYANYISALTSNYTDNLRREIYEKMNCAAEAFHFSTFSAAEENFAMRERIVFTTDQVNSRTLDVASHAWPNVWSRIGSTYFNTQLLSWAVGAYWKPDNTDLSNPTNRMFVTRDEASAMPYDAIMHATPFRNECLAVWEYCVLSSAANVLGQPGFDAVHTESGGPFLSIGFGTYGLCMSHHVIAVSDSDSLVPGDYAYMKNKDDYAQWSSGPWRGENCIYMGMNEEYVGLFSGLGVDRDTEADLRDRLEAHYLEDCPGHTVENPLTQIRFMEKGRHILGN